MGGGGEWSPRDVSSLPPSRRTKGYSEDAEKSFAQTKADKTTTVKNRSLATEVKSPIVLACDVTGSMGGLPKIFWTKMPMMAGQLIQRGYLEEPQISFAAIGDVIGDDDPLQVGDFVEIKDADTQLQKLHIEGGGGGTSEESYEFMAYFYAYRAEMPNAETPMFVFTGDEGFRENLDSKSLRDHFGGVHGSVTADEVFTKLKEMFKGNVFLIHRRYNSVSTDARIVAQWQRVLGREKVIILGEDKAIVDVTLGLFALVSGKRKLEEYLEDMKNREQTDERVSSVRQSLTVLADYLKKNPAVNMVKSKKPDAKSVRKGTGKKGRLDF